ncbi:hypothetical protein PV08_10486 [Exophiala spinifera]|uniref:Zn(2)-C6 fungal-type domain-containing protein n=1 Tax=Exophiala spinifera TaxID=91928 RepID=A0A0D1Y874_9EURO|nr:uncharacterized protein PV08_10486 [Exophiala spinifera]KIW11186.1 hypothetical protein PV08_10486 [Exophiala spinifera]
MTKAKLRTKIGCLTCRKRKLKCDESRPCCLNCTFSRRLCVWPTPAELYDRRNRRRSEDGVPKSATGGDNDVNDVQNSSNLLQPGDCYNLDSTWLIVSSPQPRTSISSECDNSLLCYYTDSFLSVILLPTTKPSDYDSFRSYTLMLALECQSVKHAVMSSSAANKYMLTGEDHFRRLSLEHYAQAVKEVNHALANIDYSRESWADPLLISVAYLYIHAFWGPDADKDAAKHVLGMQQLFKLRYTGNTSPVCVDRPFDRIMVESALYHSFLLAMRNPFALDFHIDSFFLSKTLDLLEFEVYVDPAESAKSPVIGAPPSIYRLTLEISRMFNSGSLDDAEEFTRIRSTMDYWEQLLDSEASIFRDSEFGDAVELYILAASLLLDWISELPHGAGPITLTALSMLGRSTTVALDGKPRHRWQVARALSVLRRPDTKHYWTWCFLSSWPLLVFGYAVEDVESMDLVKEVLNESRHCIGYAEMERIERELEGVWKIRLQENCHREFLPDAMSLQGQKIYALT